MRPLFKRNLAITAVAWMACWIGAYWMEAADVFDSRWNYRMHGPFQACTPSLSADGSLIVFDSSRTGNGDIYTAGTNGAASQVLIGTKATESHPVFTWSGEAIAFARQTGGYQHVWLYHLRDKTETQLTTGRVIDVPVSNTTKGIIFRRSTSYGRLLLPKSELFATPLNGFNESTSQRFGDVKCVSPDGESVVRMKKDATSGQEELWIENRAGTNTHRIGAGWGPSFSHDGKQIVYLSQTPDYKSEVMLINSDGTDQRQLPAPAGYKTAPRFCMDGAVVCFRIPTSPRDGPGGAYIVHLRDSKSEKLNAVTGEPIH